MSKKRTEVWLTLVALGLGLPIAVVIGIVTYVKATNPPPLHASISDIPSVVAAPPADSWAATVDQARRIVRAGVIDGNLPGVSVAVGVGNEIVWAEGFGWANVANKVPVAPNMRFRIGHVSKVLTSAALGLLIDQGRIHLGDEIQ